MLKALNNFQTIFPSYQAYAQFTTNDLIRQKGDKILYQNQIQTLNEKNINYQMIKSIQKVYLSCEMSSGGV